MIAKERKKKINKKSKAKNNSPGSADAVPALFSIFPFSTLFLPAIIAAPAGDARDKRAPEALPKNFHMHTM